MTYSEIRRQIRKQKYVFVFVRLTEHDGFYIQAVKSSLFLTVTDETVHYIAEVRDDGLYIG